MSVTFNANVYGLTGMGRKVKIGTAKDTVVNAFPVGGKIFFISQNDNNAIYHFFNESGDEITDIQVGDSPYAYTIDGTPESDKFYVFYPHILNNGRWTYGTYNGVNTEYVYESLGAADGIGQGKINTNIIMSKSSGAYIKADSAGDGTNVPTIWKILSDMRENKVAGQDDWFIPAKAELEIIRTSNDRKGNPLTELFNNYSIWSSATDTVATAWRWYRGNNFGAVGKNEDNVNLLCARAF